MSDGTDRLVVSVAARAEHGFSKQPRPSIRLIAGLGVEGDAHCGATVRHRSRVAADPTAANLRQVHLLSAERLAALAGQGFAIAPGDLGENILTRGLDLHALPTGTRLAIGAEAVVELTGLRNPCGQIEAFRAGLLAEMVTRAGDGSLIRRAGVMGVVVVGGIVLPGDAIALDLPDGPHRPLERV